MKHLKRKLITLLTAVCMLCTMSVPVFGAENPEASKLSNPRTAGDTVTWDCVWFGHYPQSSNGKGGYNNDPIKWRVLSVKDGKALLLSDKNLDAKGYHKKDTDVIWATSTTRKWLNGTGAGDFLGKAFSNNEQKAICVATVKNQGASDTQDKIFNLSVDEATNQSYGFDKSEGKSKTRESFDTAYAASRPGTDSAGEGAAGYWWLRSPSLASYSASYVYTDGMIDNVAGSNVSGIMGIRPALWVDVNGSDWSYAGTISKKAKSKQKVSVKKVILKKAASTKKGTLKLTWKRDTKATGYQAMVSTDKKFKKNKKTATIKKNKTVTKSFTKLKRGKTYFAKVRAYKKVGKKKVYGAYSKVKKARVK